MSDEDDPRIDELYERLWAAESERDSLRERVRVLEGALRPFAELGAEIGDGIMAGIIWKDDQRIDGASAYNNGKDYFITVGDLRRASSALAGA